MGNKPTLVSSFINAAYIEATRDQRRFNDMTTTKAEQPTITQDDWDMAIAFGNAVGGVDTSLLAEYFRRHRTTSLAAQDGLVEAIEDLRHNYRAADAGGEFIIVSIYSVNTVLDALSAIKGDKS